MSTLNQLQATQQIQSPTLTPDQQAQINKLLEQSKSSNTIDAYQSDWKQFTDFCLSNNLTPLPTQTETLLLYISELSKTHKYASIRRKLSSINKANNTAGYPSPTYNSIIKDMMDGVKRTIGSKQTPKEAITLDILKPMIDAIDVSTLSGKRDKALILMSFSIASRRSEVVAIDVKDITFTNEGMDVSLFESKTQSYITKSVLYARNEYCPVEALKQWLETSNIKSHAVFRSINKYGNIGERLHKKTVANLVKEYVEKIGLDPNDFAGHSLRSGLVTSAAEEGYNDQALMNQTGHKTRNMIDRYSHNGNRYKNNVTEILKKLN